jgi:hypothetical protein
VTLKISTSEISENLPVWRNFERVFNVLKSLNWINAGDKRLWKTVNSAKEG